MCGGTFLSIQTQHCSEWHTCILISGSWTALKMEELSVNTAQVSSRGRCSPCSVPTCKGLGAGDRIDTGGTGGKQKEEDRSEYDL